MVEIALRETSGIPHPGEPVRCGVPFGRGELQTSDECTLEDDSGAPVPFASRPLAWWDDDSVKWLLVDFAADVPARDSARYRLRRGSSGEIAASPLAAEEPAPGPLRVDTGAIRLEVGPFPESGFHVRLESATGTWEIDPLGANLRDAGTSWEVTPESAECALEHVSPRRAVIRLQADLILADGERPGRPCWKN